jgi:hypothetical protein
LPPEVARAISRHPREIFPTVGVHTRLVRATCLTSVAGTCEGKGVVRDEALRDRALDQRSFATLLDKTPEPLDEMLTDRAWVSAGEAARTVAQHHSIRTSA